MGKPSRDTQSPLQYVLEGPRSQEVDWTKFSAEDWLAIMRTAIRQVNFKNVGGPKLLTQVLETMRATIAANFGETIFLSDPFWDLRKARVVNPDRPMEMGVFGGLDVYITDSANLVAVEHRRNEKEPDIVDLVVFMLTDTLLLKLLEATVAAHRDTMRHSVMIFLDGLEHLVSMSTRKWREKLQEVELSEAGLNELRYRLEPRLRFR